MTTLGLQVWFVLVTLVFAHAFQSQTVLSNRQHQKGQWPPFPERSHNDKNTPRQSKSSLSLTISDHAPSWDVCLSQLLSTPTGSRLQQETIDRAKGLGVPHTDALLRLFPENINNIKNGEHNTEDDVRVTFYRDQAGWCPYCQKVWLFLEQKQIPYRVKKVPLNAYGDKAAWFTRKVDGGKLPAIELEMGDTDDDTLLQVESIEIMKLLEQTFPNHDPRMMPAVPDEKNDSHDNDHAKMKALLDLEQELQQAWFSLVFYPVKDEALAKANQTFVKTLTKVNEALGHTEGPWFLGGNDPSFVDIQYITVMERIAASVLYWNGLDIRSLDELPFFQTWMTAFERLPHYLASRSDYYTHSMAIPSQNGPGFLIPSAKPIANRISGLLGAWNLPLDPEECLEPMPGPARLRGTNGDDNDKDAYSACHEAAYKLIENHANIVLFACRGAGEPGRPSFHAELADPYAEPNEEYLQAVDVSLRHVANALLHGLAPKDETDSNDKNNKSAVKLLANQDLWRIGGSNELRENWEAYPDDDDPSLTYYWNYETGDATWTPPTQQLDTCLSYLRDRIGVPRDMGPAAAMELRAHLNWAIALMQAED